MAAEGCGKMTNFGQESNSRFQKNEQFFKKCVKKKPFDSLGTECKMNVVH